MLVALIGAHCFFDFAGQGDFMARAKNSRLPVQGVPWLMVLVAHASIHGTAAALITGLWWVFLAEALLHGVTDDAKSRGYLTFTADQLIHLICKVLWFAAACRMAT